MVLLPSAAFASMMREARRAEPLETGGLLVGYRAADLEQIVVTAVVGPGPAARHQRLQFAPDQEWQAKLVARLYELSGRRHTYLGDWHTHPGGAPRPSRKDQRVARLIAGAPAARVPEPIMLIVGQGRDGRRRIGGYVQRRYLRRTRIRLTDAPVTIIL